MIVGRRHTERFGRLVGTDSGDPVVRSGRAPCVIAFHGFTGTTSELRPVIDCVADQGHAVRAPILPGHGSSAAHLQDATFDTWVSGATQELALAQQQFGRFILCGFSLGSLVALELASRAPRGLAGLVLLGNAVTLTPFVRGALGFVDRRGWTLPDWYLLKLWSPDVRDREQRKKILAYDRDPLRAALEVYRAGRRVEERLSRVTCPTLVIHGGKDRVCPATNARFVAQRLGTTDVEVKLYPESGHLVAADVDRFAVADDVARFVDRVSRERAERDQRVPVEP